jgi:hypothetical protein
MPKSDALRYPAAKEIMFTAAWEMFPAIRKRWNEDGTAKE